MLIILIISYLNVIKDRDGETTNVEYWDFDSSQFALQLLNKKQTLRKIRLINRVFCYESIKKESSIIREGVCISGDRAYFYRDGQIQISVLQAITKCVVYKYGI